MTQDKSFENLVKIDAAEIAERNATADISPKARERLERIGVRFRKACLFAPISESRVVDIAPDLDELIQAGLIDVQINVGAWPYKIVDTHYSPGGLREYLEIMEASKRCKPDTK